MYEYIAHIHEYTAHIYKSTYTSQNIYTSIHTYTTIQHIPYGAQKAVGSKKRLVTVAATGFAEALAERENGT